jgi:OmpA-OmpF porin, OOP family
LAKNGSDTPLFGNHSTPVEILLGARADLGGFLLGAAGGFGPTKALGTAEMRALLSFGYAVRPEEPRSVGDRDRDAINDDEDACPDLPGTRTSNPATNGCPADRDGDKIVDAEDACPDVVGVRDPDPKKNGCPADRDGVADPDPKKNGCPPVVRIEGQEIKISEQVHFATGKATILPDSDNLLRQVADIVKAHPEIKFVSIEGHTDNTGKPANNKRLSKARADSVKQWLVKKGKLDNKRLFTVGFGDTKPLQTNDSAEGRQSNRRVEFHILDEAPNAAPKGAPKGAPKKPAKP